MEKKHRALTLFIWLLSISIVACKSSQPQAEDFVGLWIEDSAKCEDSSSCGSIELSSDARFDARNVPELCFGYVTSLTDTKRMNGTGVWQLNDAGDSTTIDQINLKFKANPDAGTPVYNTTIYIDKLYNSKLYCWLGDPKD